MQCDKFNIEIYRIQRWDYISLRDNKWVAPTFLVISPFQLHLVLQILRHEEVMLFFQTGF